MKLPVYAQDQVLRPQNNFLTNVCQEIDQEGVKCLVRPTAVLQVKKVARKNTTIRGYWLQFTDGAWEKKFTYVAAVKMQQFFGKP